LLKLGNVRPRATASGAKGVTISRRAAFRDFYQQRHRDGLLSLGVDQGLKQSLHLDGQLLGRDGVIPLVAGMNFDILQRSSQDKLCGLGQWARVGADIRQ
jgi:hypothetical protein